MRQTFDVIANDFGVIRIDAAGPDGERDTIELEGLSPGDAVTVTLMAGTANPIEGGHP